MLAFGVMSQRVFGSQEQGQSLIEFLIMFPFLIGLSLMMLKIATAIQVSIVNQKFARSHALFLAFNSPYFPQRVKFIEGSPGMTDAGSNLMIVGVAQNFFSTDESKPPAAETVGITRAGQKDQGDNSGGSENPTSRGLVRIRDTVAICTQRNFVLVGADAFDPINSGTLKEDDVPYFCRKPNL